MNNNPKPNLYLLVGYPGSGKTTLSKYISEKTNAVHLWADQERQAMFDFPSHSKEESDQLYNALDIKTSHLLANGMSVIFDTNLNYFDDRQLLREIGRKNNANNLLIWLTTPKHIAKTRALHHTHRDKNGYIATMTEAEFEHLTNHLEKPTEIEQPIKIDGTKIDYQLVDSLLQL